MDNGIIVRSAVGRVARLGDLYDARSDTFPNISIFNNTPPTSAIGITDNPFSDIQYIVSDKLSEKFDKLNISGELRASFMGGLISLEGHGKYLYHEKKSERAVRSSLLYSIETKVEQLDLFNKELKGYFSIESLDSDFATHVVVGVSWGAKAMVTLEHKNSKNEESKKIEGALKAHLNKFSVAITGNVSVDYETNEDIREDSYSLRVFGDILPGGNLPQTVKEAMVLMKKMPHLIQKANQGKGKPIQYTLVPITILDKYLNGTTRMADQLVKQLDEHAILGFVQLFDEISITKQQLNDLDHDLQSHKHCVPKEIIKNLSQTIVELDKEVAKLRSKLGKTFIEVRSGNAGAEQLETIRVEFLSSDFSLEKVKTMMNDYDTIKEKISFADALTQEGISYIGIGASIESEQMKAEGDIYILFFGAGLNQSDQQSWSENRHHFMSLFRSSKISAGVLGGTSTNQLPTPQQTFIAVDLDVRPEIARKEGVGEGIRICHYKNGEYVNLDVLAEHLKKLSTCFAESITQKEICNKPNKRVILQLRCPGTLSGSCEIIDHTWHCTKCEEKLDYGFDGFFYCSCGRAKNTTFRFKCSSKNHGKDFVGFSEKELKTLIQLIQPLKEMNILILGVTGVGKSTWINGIINYLTYPSLESAAKGKLLNITSASFQLTDDNDVVHHVQVGKDKNEIHKPGQSGTQKPKAHIFHLGDTLVRLIDTPGIGDISGYNQDIKNFEAILQYLSTLDILHGICILLKPNESKLDVLFQYCVKELLTHLHRSASENIVFCFTNSRGTNYKPGDTRGPLTELLKQNQVEITLNKHTMYCMDNESFRFLCAVSQGIQFKESIEKSFSESWNISVEETDRLFTHIKQLKPHVIVDTLSLNDARNNIFCLRKPLADISQNIQLNISVAEDRKKEVLCSKESEAKLAKSLYIDAFELVPSDLNHPRTVCTNEKCVKYHKVGVGETMVVEYVNHCHPECYLEEVPTEIVADKNLKYCKAMNEELYCIKCSCYWDQHMHLTYEQKRVSVRVVDNSIQTQISDKEADRKRIELFIQNTENYCKELKAEQKKIMEVSAKFAGFLSYNAITLYNDALGKYLDHLIKKEEEKSAISKDRQTLNRMIETRKGYYEEVKILKEAMSQPNFEKLSPSKIKELVAELFALKHNGKQLEKSMKKESSSKSKMIEYHESYYETKYVPQMKHSEQGSKPGKIRKKFNFFASLW